MSDEKERAERIAILRRDYPSDRNVDWACTEIETLDELLGMPSDAPASFECPRCVQQRLDKAEAQRKRRARRRGNPEPNPISEPRASLAGE